jgi:hypothetical protein
MRIQTQSGLQARRGRWGSWLDMCIYGFEIREYLGLSYVPEGAYSEERSRLRKGNRGIHLK